MSAKSKSTRCHTIQKALLKNFSSNNGQYNYFTYDGSEHKYGINNVNLYVFSPVVKRDYYSQEVEKKMNIIEKEAIKAIRQLLKNVKDIDLNTILTFGELLTLKFYVFLSLFRSEVFFQNTYKEIIERNNDIHTYLEQNEDDKALIIDIFILQLVKQFENAFVYDHKEQKSFLSKKFHEIEKNNRIDERIYRQIIEECKRYSHSLLNLSLFRILKFDKKELLIGGCQVINCKSTKGSLMFILPISPDLAILLYMPTLEVVDLGREKIHLINKNIFESETLVKINKKEGNLYFKPKLAKKTMEDIDELVKTYEPRVMDEKNQDSCLDIEKEKEDTDESIDKLFAKEYRVKIDVLSTAHDTLDELNARTLNLSKNQIIVYQSWDTVIKARKFSIENKIDEDCFDLPSPGQKL